MQVCSSKNHTHILYQFDYCPLKFFFTKIQAKTKAKTDVIRVDIIPTLRDNMIIDKSDSNLFFYPT